MATIVEADRSGRIVIPKKIRDELGITEKTQFILTKNQRDQILLQKIDVKEMAKRLEEELEGKPIDSIVESIRKEINEKVKAHYPDLPS